VRDNDAQRSDELKRPHPEEAICPRTLANSRRCRSAAALNFRFIDALDPRESCASMDLQIELPAAPCATFAALKTKTPTTTVAMARQTSPVTIRTLNAFTHPPSWGAYISQNACEANKQR
jgi:hypothetical protein